MKAGNHRHVGIGARKYGNHHGAATLFRFPMLFHQASGSRLTPMTCLAAVYVSTTILSCSFCLEARWPTMEWQPSMEVERNDLL
jgi:hypothetical protein